MHNSAPITFFGSTDHMKIYLSGPMSGYEFYNFPTFDYAADLLRAEGHEVFSPADNDRVRGLDGRTDVPFPKGVTARDLIMDDVEYIARHADAIALLPGYEKSKGAKVEVAMADFLGLSKMELGHRYVPGNQYRNDWLPSNPRELVAPHK